VRWKECTLERRSWPILAVVVVVVALVVETHSHHHHSEAHPNVVVIVVLVFTRESSRRLNRLSLHHRFFKKVSKAVFYITTYRRVLFNAIMRTFR